MIIEIIVSFIVGMLAIGTVALILLFIDRVLVKLLQKYAAIIFLVLPISFITLIVGEILFRWSI